MRLYLLQLGYDVLADGEGIAIPGYVIQTDDGKNVLVDTGFPRAVRGRQAEEADRIRAQSGGDPLLEFTAWIISALKEDPADWIENRLAEIGLRPADIDLLVATHFDMDHSGSLDMFSHAPIYVQRRHFVEAKAHRRYRLYTNPWEMPELNFHYVDGDTELLPGIELIETSGHAPGHQSLLVRLPKTGAVLLAVDAAVAQIFLNPEAPDMLQDFDQIETRASRKKLLALAEREQAKLIVFGHDAEQWPTLRHSPQYYE